MEKRHEGHHHMSATKQVLLTLIIIVAVIILGIVIYYSFSGPSSNIYDLHCKIEPAFKTMNLNLGNIAPLQVTNYQGTLDNVYWTTEDSSIAVVNPQSGEGATVEAKKIGTTNIIATDNTVGPECTTSITIIVGE